MRRVAPGILAVAAGTLRATLRGALRSRTVVRHRRRGTRSGAAARYRGECGRELKRKAPDQVLWDAAGHLLAEADDSRRQTVVPCVPVGAGAWVCGCVRACEIGCELARVHGGEPVLERRRAGMETVHENLRAAQLGAPTANHRATSQRRGGWALHTPTAATCAGRCCAGLCALQRFPMCANVRRSSVDCCSGLMGIST